MREIVDCGANLEAENVKSDTCEHKWPRIDYFNEGQGLSWRLRCRECGDVLLEREDLA